MVDEPKFPCPDRVAYWKQKATELEVELEQLRQANELLSEGIRSREAAELAACQEADELRAENEAYAANEARALQWGELMGIEPGDGALVRGREWLEQARANLASLTSLRQAAEPFADKFKEWATCPYCDEVDCTKPECADMGSFRRDDDDVVDVLVRFGDLRRLASELEGKGGGE